MLAIRGGENFIDFLLVSLDSNEIIVQEESTLGSTLDTFAQNNGLFYCRSIRAVNRNIPDLSILLPNEHLLFCARSEREIRRKGNKVRTPNAYAVL